ncbi:MAG: stalk domain-containing protein [Bacteroidia bacterium]
MYYKIIFLTCLCLAFVACKPSSTSETYLSNAEPQNLLSSLSPRILLNGEIMGNNQSAYLEPNWEGDNLMGDAALLLQQLDYTVNWDESKGELKATRNAANQYGKKMMTFFKNKDLVQIEEKTYRVPKPCVVKSEKLVVAARFLLEMAGAKIVEWDKESNSLQAYYYEKLDYGIYFYGKQSTNDSVAGAQKFVPNQTNLFFDPNKPTIIYTHGWQQGGTKSGGRENFTLKDNSIEVFSHNNWIDKGWNVAIFHWVQFADDGSIPPPREAEAKIYDIHNTLSNIRWTRSNGALVTDAALLPSKNVTELYAEEYAKVFNATYQGSEIRLVGNSLGGNLTMALLMELHQKNIAKKPQRITLIDPYWSFNLTSNQVTFPYNYTDAYQLSTAAAKIYRDQYNAAIEYFRTSLAGTIGTNDSLIAVTAFSHFGTDYSWNVVNKHTVPVRQYFWSMNFLPPAELTYLNNVPTGNVAASARTPHARIRELMVNHHYWNHVQGRGTVTPADDKYEIREGLR